MASVIEVGVVSMYDRSHPNPGVAAVTFLMDDWLHALEGGSYIYRLPDPNYSRQWTDDELDLLMKSMDAEIDQEVARTPGTSVGAKAGPGYVRLPVPQRRAFAQQLHDCCLRHRDSLVLLVPHPDGERVERYPIEPTGSASVNRWIDGTYFAQLDGEPKMFAFAVTPEEAKAALAELLPGRPSNPPPPDTVLC